MKIISPHPLPEFRLQLHFDNGESGIVDLSSFAGRGVFEVWNQPSIFDSVVVTDEGAVAWPREVDLCPDALYLRMTGKKSEDIFPDVHDRLSHA